MPIRINMSSNINDVMISMKRIQDKTREQVIDLALDVIKTAHEDVVRDSPVDTGRYKASNVLTEGAPSTLRLDLEPDQSTPTGQGAEQTLAMTGEAGASISAEGQNVLSKPGKKGKRRRRNFDHRPRIEEAIEHLKRAREVFLREGRVSVFITNRLPYAWRIENGHSKQAPMGVYGIARQRAVEALRKVGLLK